MATVRFTLEGLAVEVPLGKSILDAANAAGAPEGSHCGGVCACSTCHVVVTQGFELLEPADEIELDLLEMTDDREETSRLGCQAVIRQPGHVEVTISDESFQTWLDMNERERDRALRLRGIID